MPARDGLQTFADELAVLRPREIIVPGDSRSLTRQPPLARSLRGWPTMAATGLPITAVDAWAFDDEAARRALLDQLRAGGLEGFGLDGTPAASARRAR